NAGATERDGCRRAAAGSPRFRTGAAGAGAGARPGRPVAGAGGWRATRAAFAARRVDRGLEEGLRRPARPHRRRRGAGAGAGQVRRAARDRLRTIRGSTRCGTGGLPRHHQLARRGLDSRSGDIMTLAARIDEALRRLTRAQWLPQLLVRLFVGYFFLESGWGKIHNLDAFTERFAGWGSLDHLLDKWLRRKYAAELGPKAPA